MNRGFSFIRLILFAGSLGLFSEPARADQLDDLISGMRNGDSSTPAPDKASQVYASSSLAVKRAFYYDMVDLYLQEIKLSIVDPVGNGGWPYRSFLLDRALDFDGGDGSGWRRGLTVALKQRFDAKPDAMLAYAMICPAIYAGDENLVSRMEDYLKTNDPFLYKLEQNNITQYWRPGIKTILDKESAALSKLKEP